MEGKKEENNSLAAIMETIKSFSSYLFRKWWILALTMIVGAGIGAALYTSQEPKYEADTTFILEEKSSGGSGLAGLASQFGFNLGNLSGGGSLFSGDNILDILKSKKIVNQVLLSKMIDTTSNGQTLADLYMEFTNLKKYWQKKPALTEISFIGMEGRKLNPLQDSVLNVLYERIIKRNLSVDRFNKKGSIINVVVSAPNAAFARLMSERLVDAASKLYMDIRTGTSQDNIRQLQQRADSLLILLNRKSFTAAASQPIDINPALRTAVVPTEIATRDKTVLATLYAEVTKNLEASKLLLSQQTPVIQVLDKPGYLLEDKKKSLLLLLAGSIIGLELVVIVGTFFTFYYNKHYK